MKYEFDKDDIKYLKILKSIDFRKIEIKLCGYQNDYYKWAVAYGIFNALLSLPISSSFCFFFFKLFTTKNTITPINTKATRATVIMAIIAIKPTNNEPPAKILLIIIPPF